MPKGESGSTGKGDWNFEIFSLFIGIHTHSAPVTGYRPHEGPNFIARKPQIVKETTKRYEKLVQEKLLKAAHRALYEMRPAQLGFAYGESHVNVNRCSVLLK